MRMVGPWTHLSRLVIAGGWRKLSRELNVIGEDKTGEGWSGRHGDRMEGGSGQGDGGISGGTWQI